MNVRRRFGLWLGGCAVLAAIVLLLMPAEKTLGQVIKIVYLHGALSRAGMLGFVLAGLAGLAHLVTSRVRLARWSKGLAWAGWAFWAAHFLVSMPATRLTWGPWIAWGEPRVTMTLQVAAAGLVVILVSWLIDNVYFTSAANVLLGGAVIFLADVTSVLRHPLDPIGASPSPVLRLVYFVLLVPVIVAMFLCAWRWAAAAPENSAAGAKAEARGGLQ